MADSALYTRKGDSGQTQLGNGRRVPKTHGSLEVLGNAEELLSAISLARAILPQTERELDDRLYQIQQQLIRLQEDIRRTGPPKGITAEDIRILEEWIDACAACAAEKDPQRIPADTPAAARLDMARSIARRMERSLSKAGLPAAVHQRYLNRLSDYFYAAARYLQVQEKKAVPPERKPTGYAEKSLTLKMAKTLLEAMERIAEAQGLRLVMAVCDAAGHPIAVHVMEDAFIASYDIAVNKAWTAVSLKMPTKALAELCKPGGSLYGLQNTNDGRIVIFGGGVVLQDPQGRILGGFAVSGSTAEIDTRMGDIGERVFHQLYSKGGDVFGDH